MTDKQYDINTDPDEDCKKSREQWAFLHQLPSFSAALALSELHSEEDGIDVGKMRELLAEHSQELSSGKLDRMEAMLATQAHVLQSVFTKYVGVASRAEYLVQFKGYMGIALKAQNQCRQTISVLGELKNPKRATFIKQQNKR